MDTRWGPSGTREEVAELTARHLSRGKVAFFRQLGIDVVMGERTGPWFTDPRDGRRFFNCHCNGGVFNLGHRHPAVASALRRALDDLDIGNHHLPSGWRAALAERLSATTGHRLSGVVLSVSGGEAIDVAIKAARAATGRLKIVSAVGGYHGHTGLAVAAGDPAYREPFLASLPGFQQVPFDDLPALEAAVDADTAAVLLEPVPATLGMPIASPGYLAGVQALCRARGACFVVDEVQTGLGRTGAMWSHQLDGLTPDVVVSGKGLSGGLYPIAATLMTPRVHEVFDARPFAHISTFGGAEPGCAAALAVLDVVEAPGFLARVGALSDRIAQGLSGLPVQVRRRGLMMGLKTAEPQGGIALASRFHRAGLFAVFAANDPSVLQFLPPLVLGDDEVAWLVERVRGVFA